MITLSNKILLVDDEADIINIVSFRLKKAGYDVIVAATGIDALAKAITELPELILLDINLPQMSGYEVCSRLKSAEETKKIPVIFMSASAENISENTRKYGADGFIIKPFETESFISKISEYLGSSAKIVKNTVEVDENIKELMPKFMQEKNKNIAELKEALEKNDFETIQRIGHAWRGGGSLYNVHFVTEKGILLEAAAKNRKAQEIRILIPEIGNYFNNLDIKYIKAPGNGKTL
ncbi:MAG: hypothetical protein A3J83_00320 [Elusimicrobia bacterium RIFOXYA2_FULL_40_6]|nr:MAG: hypothetical protein A3J83_00320 [Elusimicrobia bacterium RIFOXYA2_FULL_40_6]